MSHTIMMDIAEKYKGIEPCVSRCDVDKHADVYSDSIGFFMSSYLRFESLMKSKAYENIRADLQSRNIDHVQQISQLYADGGLYSVSKEVDDYIKDNAIYEVDCKNVMIQGRKISFSIIITNEDDYNLDVCHTYIKMMCYWLDFAYAAAKNTCSKELHVVIMMADVEKKLPDNIIDVLGTPHVNSGYTWSCRVNNKIVVYRKEEWLKVFIHETFHALGLDNISFTQKTNRELKTLFPISSDISVGEAYCEFWARIMKCCIFAFFGTLKVKIKERRIVYMRAVSALLNTERMFSIFQGIKVLRYMNLSYNDMIDTGRKASAKREKFYKEDSNVFAYYVLTMILMYQYNEFLKWCDQHNTNIFVLGRTQKTQQALFDYFKNMYNSRRFTDVVDCVEEYYETILNDDKNRALLQTTRMSVVDLNLTKN